MACTWPCKIILTVVNIATILLGIALMAIGGIMAWGQNVVEGLLHKFIEPVVAHLQPNPENVVDIIKRILTTTAPLGIAIFIVGIILLVTSIIGFLGVFCSKIFLYIYAALMGALAVTVLGIFIYYYVNRDKISSKLADIYGKYVTTYVSLEVNDESSLAVLLVQGQLQCCGDNNSEDFINFSPNDRYDSKAYTGLTAPIPCCKMTPDYGIKDTTCPNAFNDINSNLKTGCRPSIKQTLENNLNTIFYVMIGIFGALLAVMILAILAACCC